MENFRTDLKILTDIAKQEVIASKLYGYNEIFIIISPEEFINLRVPPLGI